MPFFILLIILFSKNILFLHCHLKIIIMENFYKGIDLKDLWLPTQSCPYVLFVDDVFDGSFSSPYTFYIHLIFRVLPKLIGDYFF